MGATSPGTTRSTSRTDDDGERVEAGAFCNHACLAAHIDDAELTYGDACEWSPDLEDG